MGNIKKVEEKVLHFYRRIVFGSAYHKDNYTRNDIYGWCFDNAWNDMARHVYTKIDGCELKEDIKKYMIGNELHNIQDKEKPKSTTEIIIGIQKELKDKIGKYNRKIGENKSGFTIGKMQKIINMFFKYLYLFKEDLELDKDYFKECDCPVDNKILNNSDFKDVGKKDPNVLKEKLSKIKWSKLTDIELYKQIQEVLRQLVTEQKLESLLDFDFENWE